MSDFAKELMIKLQDRKFCRCLTVTIDEHNREVSCQKCGRILDPFDFLKAHARRGWQSYRQLNAMQKEIKSLRLEIEQLKAERRKVKQSLNYYNSK